MWDVFDHKHIHVFGQLLLGIYDDYGIDWEKKKSDFKKYADNPDAVLDFYDSPAGIMNNKNGWKYFS